MGDGIHSMRHQVCGRGYGLWGVVSVVRGAGVCCCRSNDRYGPRLKPGHQMPNVHNEANPTANEWSRSGLRLKGVLYPPPSPSSHPQPLLSAPIALQPFYNRPHGYCTRLSNRPWLRHVEGSFVVGDQCCSTTPGYNETAKSQKPHKSVQFQDPLFFALLSLVLRRKMVFTVQTKLAGRR